MAQPLRSIADGMANQSAQGDWDVVYNVRITPATTVNTGTTSGYQTVARWQETPTVPTLGGSVPYAYCKSVRATALTGSGGILVGLETNGGTLTVSGNSFAAGTALPSRKSSGASAAVQLASTMPILWSSASATATTPVVTIGYTNEAGTSSRSMTMTLPTNSLIGSAYLMSPHLQSGDLGIRSIDSMSISTGTAGVFKVGLLVPFVTQLNGAATGCSITTQFIPVVQPGLLAGDQIGVYRIGTNSSSVMSFGLTLGPET